MVGHQPPTIPEMTPPNLPRAVMLNEVKDLRLLFGPQTGITPG